jgi:hypothetical protein
VRELEICTKMFKGNNSFAVKAIIIVVVLAALYAIFW